MRISDWSSDVCSSDLQKFVDEVDIEVGPLGDFQGVFLEVLAVDHFFGQCLGVGYHHLRQLAGVIERAQRFCPLQYMGTIGLGKIKRFAVGGRKKQHLLVQQSLEVTEEIQRFLVGGQYEYKRAFLQLVARHEIGRAHV